MTAPKREGETTARSRRRLCLAVLLSILLDTSCGGVKLESTPRDRPIIIDGKAAEWQDSLTVVEQAQMAVGLSNDEHDLYICITSWNQDVNLQAMNLGFTLWFDPAGRDEKTFGVEYPIMEDLIQSKDRPASGDVVPLPDATGRTAARLAVRGPLPWDRHIMALSDAPGLQVSVSSLNGTFVYELKVPLQRVVGMTLETTRAPAYRQEQGQAAGPRAGGGGAGRGGGMGGGMGGRRHGGTGGGMPGGGAAPRQAGPESPRIPKPLRVTAKVRLAAVTAPSGD